MIVDDELRDHMALSLMHLTFVRELMRRTGYVEEINALGWPYGADPNGGWSDDLYDGQLHTMLDLLAPDFHGEVTFSSFDDERWASCHVIDGVHDRDSVVFDIACVIKISGTDARELEEWRHFIWWQACNFQHRVQTNPNPHTSDSIMFVDETDQQPHFIWVLPEASADEILDAWHKILVTWEVIDFYGNVANARAWRELRGTSDSNDGIRTNSKTPNHAKRSNAVQDGRIPPVAQSA